MEVMDESYYYSDSGESLDAYDQEQMEIALYCKIHFETNLEHSGIDEECMSTDFDILVEGNKSNGYKAAETTAEYVLNKDIEKKYDSVMNDADDGRAKSKRFDTKKVDRTKQVTDEVKNSKQIQSVLRKPDHSKSLLGDSGFYSDLSKDVICIDDDTSSMDSVSDSDDQDVLLDESSSDADDDIKINVVHTSNNTSTPRYTYTKMSPGEADTNIAEESDDGGHWAINDEDVFKDKGVTPHGRYYKPVRCHNCNFIGHLSKNCPKPKKGIVCAMCGDEGHICRNCPKSFCFNCEEAGHDSKYCTAPRRRWNRSCRRCQMPGHDEKECPEQWRQYHVTIKPGRINKFKFSRKRKRISCYNCGDDGHYGHECEEDRMNRFLRVNSPFITRYQNVKQFCDVIHSVRGDDTVEQSEDANVDGGWKSFGDIDAHVKTLRENIRDKVTARRTLDRNSADTKKPSGLTVKRTSDKNSVDTKKPSEYIHMVKKSGKLNTGRNNFDKMSFTIQNERGQGKSRRKQTLNVESKEDKDSSVKDLSRKERRRDRQRKRKQGLSDDVRTFLSSDRPKEKDFPNNNEFEIVPSNYGQSKSKKMRKLETSNKPTTVADDKDLNLPKSKNKKSKQLTGIKEMSKAKSMDKCDDSASKARTVSYNETGNMSITAKRTPVKSSTKSGKSSTQSEKGSTKSVKSSTKSSINDRAADSNMPGNERPEFSANDLFSLWSMDPKDSKKNKTADVRPRISKKHVSHRNDNYAADDLFSLQKISKMQASGDTDIPVEEMDVDHQVHNNEWWDKGKKKRRPRRRNKHTRFQ